MKKSLIIIATLIPILAFASGCNQGKEVKIQENKAEGETEISTAETTTTNKEEKGENNENLTEEEKKESEEQSNENVKEVQNSKTPYEYWQASILNKKCETSSPNKDKGYSVWNDCLYKDGVLIQDENLNNLIVKKGNEEYKNFLTNHKWGEGTQEWFRLKTDDKLRIFLISVFGCGGCIYTGPYLEINNANNEVGIQFADLPYGGNVINSPDNKLSVFLDVEHFHKGTTDIYLYDFVELRNKGIIYTVPKEYSVQFCGDGCYISKQAIKWLDNNKIEIHLMKRGEDGLVYGNDIVFSGDPFVIDLH